MKQTIFTVDELNFRPANMKPFEVLALETIINFSDFSQASNMFDTIMEHIEVEISGTWQPLKQGNVYLPVGIEDNFNLLYRVCIKFMSDCIKPVFQNSAELK